MARQFHLIFCSRRKVASLLPLCCDDHGNGIPLWRRLLTPLVLFPRPTNQIKSPLIQNPPSPRWRVQILPPSYQLKISGFSYVYLVTDSSGSLYALKKIRCPFGQESVRNALKEVEAYNLFNHKSIIKCIVLPHLQWKWKWGLRLCRTMRRFKNAMGQRRCILFYHTFDEEIYRMRLMRI